MIEITSNNKYFSYKHINGHYKQIQYDDHKNISVIKNNNNTMNYIYKDNTVKVINSDGSWKLYAYDDYNREVFFQRSDGFIRTRLFTDLNIIKTYLIPNQMYRYVIYDKSNRMKEQQTIYF